MLALGLAGLLAIPLTGTAQGHEVRKFWRYGKDVRTHTWKDHRIKLRRHRRWHKNHPNYRWADHREFHHHGLSHRNRRKHRFNVVAKQAGEASWYGGKVGACGRPLTGLYAAHRSWPCGTKVSVRRGDRYVIVRVLDRGPFISGRVIDLSQEAFSRLGSPSSGTMDVRIFRLRKA